MRQERLTGRGQFRGQATGDPQRILVLLQGCRLTNAECNSHSSSGITRQCLPWLRPGQVAAYTGLPGRAQPFRKLLADRSRIHRSSSCTLSSLQRLELLARSCWRRRQFLGQSPLIQRSQCCSVGLSGCAVCLCRPTQLAACCLWCCTCCRSLTPAREALILQLLFLCLASTAAGRKARCSLQHVLTVELYINGIREHIA